MKLSFAAIVGALVASVCAKPAFTNLDFTLTENTPFTLEWVNATGPVTITLVRGADSQSLQPIETLTSTATGTSFTWTPSGLPSGNYAFRINDATSVSDPNFSKLIVYVGTGSTSSSSAKTTATVTSASSTETESVTSATETETETTMTTSAARTTATTTPRPTTVAPNNNNNAGQRFSSPLALVILTVGALVFFN
ncbi:hypothetical protein QBC39DRAFT_65223 [Podospora conica]|nr:hypothetical protein QBC39DRAFT_65223 [Schizothecium conicum]